MVINEDWTLIDSINIDSYIPANKSLGVKFNYVTHRLEFVTPYTFSNEALTALYKVQYGFARLLRILSGNCYGKADCTLNVIINAIAPYIDEVAYAIAYSSSQYLSSKYCNPQLFLENAQQIYKHDSELKYVEIVDYENSPANEGFYSTIKYWKIDSIKGRSVLKCQGIFITCT